MDEMKYRPGEMSDAARDELTVGREEIIEDAIGHIRSSCDQRSKHHFLFLGPRGIGKTHLLACIQDRIRRDPELDEKITLVVFPEEAIATLSFASFLTKLAQLISQQLPSETEWSAALSGIESLKTPVDIVDTLSPLFRKHLAKQSRTVIVVLENLHELLSRQFRSRTDVAALRKFFMANNGCLLLASALGHFDAITSIEEPFFDFFDVQILPALTKPQAIQLYDKSVKYREYGNKVRARKVARGMVLALHDLLGGNTRWMMFAISSMLNDPNAMIGKILAKVLEEMTPVCQAILADLAPQERALLDALAGPREKNEQPTPAYLAQRLGVSVQQASTLLKRLGNYLLSEGSEKDKRSRLYSFRDNAHGLWLAWYSKTARRARLENVAGRLVQFYCHRLCPFQLDGTSRYLISEYSDFPNPYIAISRIESQSTFLVDVDRMRVDWLHLKSQELELFSEQLGQLSSKGEPVSLNRDNYCLAKQQLLSNGDLNGDVKAYRLAQSAILYFFRNDIGSALKATKSAIETIHDKKSDRLFAVLRENQDYLESLESSAVSNKTSPLFTDTPTATIQYVENVYVSYAWGDRTTEEGIKRERVVDLLCTSLAKRGIRVGRDKNNIKPGGSIQAFAAEIARSKRIIAVLSEKSLKSKYCMVYELFQAYRRCNFDRDEFQEKVVALVLEDAKPYLESDSGIKSLVEFWKDQNQRQRAALKEKDPEGFSQDELTWLHATEEMTQRLASMIAVINDSVMPRGFDAICQDNFSDVLARLTESTEKELGATVIAQDTHASELAESVGQSIVDRFMQSTLEMNEKNVSECYQQAAEWMASGGTHASKQIRAAVLLWMSNVVQENVYLTHHGLGVARIHLTDADALLTDVEDPYLQARSLANAALIERRLGDSSSCFEALSKCEHEIALATRIALLLERKDVSTAVEIADNHVLGERWAEQAAVAYIAAKRDNDAVEACQFLRRPEFGLTRYYCCLLSCAQAYIIRSQGESGQRLTPATISPIQIEDHQQARETLEPILAKIRSAGRIATGIERESASLRFRIAHLLGDDSVSDWARLLTTFHPLHLDVLNAMRWGTLEAMPSLLADLRAENADDTDTLISCIEMDVFRRGDWEAGLDEVEKLLASVVDPEQCERMADVAFQVAAFGPNELNLRSVRLMRSLVGADHRFFAMLKAKNALQQEDFAQAEKTIREIEHEGDPDCLSLLAMALEGQGKSKEALEYLDELCEVTGHPQALWRAYRAVVATGQRDRVEPLLQRLCLFSSERVQAMELLVNLYFEQNEDESLRKVIPLLRNLAEIDPSELRYHLNHALALRALGESDEALAVAKRATLQHPDRVELQLLRSQLLVHNERAGEAFSILDSKDVKERFWGNRKFLLEYMDLAYRTGNEFDAHQAMLQLRRVELGIPEDERYVQSRSTEQLLEFLKGQREFRDDLDTRIVRGELPWTIPVHIERVPVTAAMAYRTQDLIVGESVYWRAQHTTYASNGFVVSQRDGVIGPQFVRPVAPSKGQPIVGDLTALATLFRLGVLKEVVTFFGKVLIPSIYRDCEARDAARLQPHQKSRSDQTRSLVDKIQRGKLTSYAGQLPTDAAIVDIDPEDKAVFLPGDAVQWLVDSGALTTKQQNQVLKTFDMPCSTYDGFEEARSTGRLFFTAEAVRSLDSAGVLDPLVESMNVVLLQAGVDSLRGDLFASEHQASQLRENRAFWQTIRDLDEIEFAEVELMDNDKCDQAIHNAFELALSAMKLASDRKLPLMVDDRTLLSAASNSAKGAVESAFASFDAIERLRRDRKIEQEEALSHFRKLMRWRYRFHVLDSEVLLFAIKNYRTSISVVGKPLEEIARYVQVCMQDRSLHGGNSETDPPRSIAFELYTKWMRVAAGLSVAVMQDLDFADEEVSEIVSWIVDYLVPNVPLTAPAEQQVSMAENAGRLFLTHALCRLSSEPKDDRSRFLISVVRERFNFSDLDFHQTVSDVVEGYRSLDHEAESDDTKTWRKALAVMRRLTVRHALADRATDDGYTVDSHSVAQLESTGAIRAKLDRISLSDSALEALGKPSSDLRMPESPRGALFFHRDPEKNLHVFPLLDLLTFQDTETRAAVVQYFLEPELEADGVIAKRTSSVIKQWKRKALAQTAKTWYPAMLKIEIAMRRDWQLNLAGFRQSLRTKENDWISPFWSACTCPDIHPAHSVPRHAFFAATDPGWIDEQIAEFASLPTAEESIQSYVNHFKHLPLESPRSLVDMLRLRKPNKTEWHDIVDLLLPPASCVNYLTAFQCCRALASIVDHATDTQKSQVACAVGSFIELSLSSEIELPRQRHWIALQHFATHFARWLMFYGPQLSHDNTTSLAWWLADRLAEVVAEDIEASSNPKVLTERLLKRNIHNLIQDTQLIGQFNGLDTDGSFFHLNTLQPVQGGPFLFSLLSERSNEVRLLLDDLDDSTVQKIVRWSHVRGVVGMASHETEKGLMFQYLEDKLQHCIATWKDHFDDKQLAEIKGASDSKQSLADVSFVAGLLKQFHTLEPKVHAYWFAQLRHECWRKTLKPDQYLEYFSNQQSRQLLAQSLDNDGMGSLLTLLIQLSSYADAKYVEQLPHLLLSFLDDATTDEQKQLIVHAVIRISAGTQAFSAVEHLLRRRSDPQVKAQLELEAKYTEYVRLMAPDWAWSLIRPLHQRLREH